MADPQPRRIAYMRPDEVLPALVNPKRHDADLLRASVGRFGFVEPIVLDERTGRLVAGHGRTELTAALEAMGERPAGWPADQGWPPEGVTVDDEGHWRVPVTRGWASRSDDEAHAAGIALNRGAERGGWNNQDLALVLESLSLSDAGLSGVGFERGDLTDLLALTGATGDRASEFLDGLINPALPVGQPGAAAVGGLTQASQLVLAFAERADRDAVATFLRRRAEEVGAQTMSEALLGIARAELTA